MICHGVLYADADVSFQGTPMFVAHELALKRYIYLKRLGKPPTRPPYPWVFRQNTLHDAESLFWILLWNLFTKDPTSLPRTPDYIADRQKSFLHNFVSKDSRVLIVTDEEALAQAFMSFPDSYSFFKDAVHCYRETLYSWYQKEGEWTEDSGPDESVFHGVYKDIIPIINGILGDARYWVPCSDRLFTYS